MAFFGKHTTRRDRFLSRKSFGRAHDVVGAKEVSKMLVLHEFLNLCASRAKIYYKAEASQISLVNTLFIRYTHGDSRPMAAVRLQVLVSTITMGLFRFLSIRFCFVFFFIP